MPFRKATASVKGFQKHLSHRRGLHHCRTLFVEFWTGQRDASDTSAPGFSPSMCPPATAAVSLSIGVCARPLLRTTWNPRRAPHPHPRFRRVDVLFSERSRGLQGKHLASCLTLEQIGVPARAASRSSHPLRLSPVRCSLLGKPILLRHRKSEVLVDVLGIHHMCHQKEGSKDLLAQRTSLISSSSAQEEPRLGLGLLSGACRGWS